MMFFSFKNLVQKITFQLFWLFIFVANLFVFSSEAQTKKSNTINFATCETMVQSLGSAIEDFNKNGNPNSYLVIIGGAMKGEKSSYNNRRIQEAIGYIDHWHKLGNRIVFGVGKPETKAGYLRFYVNGVLSQEIITRKNAKLCWGDGDEFNFKRD